MSEIVRTDKYLEQWLQRCRTRGLKPATLASYEDTLRLCVSDELRASQLEDVTPQQLNLHYQHLLTAGRKRGHAGLSARSVRYVHTLLRKAYADAVRLGHVQSNPADLADAPSARAARPVVRPPWSAEELTRFLRRARKDRFYSAYFLAATTGLRRGEVLGARWSDLSFEARELRVLQTVIEVAHLVTISTPKSDRSRRVVALDDQTLDVLRKHHELELQRRKDDLNDPRALVFAHVDGSPIHPACFSYAFAQAIHAAGVRRIRFHDLRHGHATMALQAGIHPKIVSERLGHSTVAITLDVYSHAIPSLQREAADAVAALIKL
jgi:integrase